jgi:hypothetical protein
MLLESYIIQLRNEMVMKINSSYRSGLYSVCEADIAALWYSVE